MINLNERPCCESYCRVFFVEVNGNLAGSYEKTGFGSLSAVSG